MKRILKELGLTVLACCLGPVVGAVFMFVCFMFAYAFLRIMP